MLHTIIPPHEPHRPEPVHPPMIFIRKPLTWEYKPVVRNLESKQALEEAELNELGEDGWEMSGIAQNPPLTYYYFKRQVEK